MRAYGELVQEPEMENGIDVVKHQKWSGANYVDEYFSLCPLSSRRTLTSH
jgi:isocitrate lyase